MNRRAQLYFLLALMGILALTVLYNLRGTPVAQALFADQKYVPLDVENPALRVDLLEKIRKTEYTGTHHNIFDRKAPPAPVRQPDMVTPIPVGPPVNPEPPPLVLPFKYFGFVGNPASGTRRACLTNGEDVWILAEGETIQNRFRLLRIGTNAADFEEIATGRKAQLRLEEQAGS